MHGRDDVIWRHIEQKVGLDQFESLIHECGGVDGHNGPHGPRGVGKRLLRSHITQFRTYMDSGEPVGRPLDFLSQELFREINTMGSKANHAQLAQLVVRAKTELEKIREQVQNIE